MISAFTCRTASSQRDFEKIQHPFSPSGSLAFSRGYTFWGGKKKSVLKLYGINNLLNDHSKCKSLVSNGIMVIVPKIP